MRHESIIVVYDSSLALAEEIAGKLGADAISVGSLDHRRIENSQSIILAIDFLADGQLTPRWQYGRQSLEYSNLHGKAVALFVAIGNRNDHAQAAEQFCTVLKQSGAHIVGEVGFATSHTWNTDYWIGTISPSL